MIIQPGIFLQSLLSLDETNFEKSIVFIAEHNHKGALGFVVNKLFNSTLNELLEFKNSPAFPIYAGGPMETEHLYFIHRRPDLIPGGQEISDSIFLGGDFKKTIELINNKTLSEKDLKIFIGYCGWDLNQLEEEVAEGSWAASEMQDLFSEKTF